MNNTVEAVLLLIKSAVTGEKATLSENVDWNSVYAISNAHRIITLVYYGIKNSGISLPADVLKLFDAKLYQSTLLSAENEYQVSNVIKLFEENGIDYLPMKGLVVQRLYPKAEMRTVGDADILIHPQHFESASKILEDSGYEFLTETSHERVWQKKHTKIELHKKIIGETYPEYSDYYADTSRFFKNSISGTHRHEMTLDDLYIYLIVHIAKHYRGGGIGLRHFIDIFVIENSDLVLDKGYINKELSRLKLEKFYANMLRMLAAWFNGEKADDVTLAMTSRILGSGTFGSHSNKLRARASNSGSDKDSSAGKFVRAVFLPLSQMKTMYPILKKAPVLLPVLWVIRIVNLLLFGHGRITKYANAVKVSTKTETEKHKKELAFVGFEV